MNNSLLIIGSIAIDHIETPAEKQENIIGGSSTYSLISASRRIPVSIVGVIGDDFPVNGHNIYNKYANNLKDLKIKEGATFKWGGRYQNNWNVRDTLFTHLGVFSDFNPVLSVENQNRSHIFLANIHPALQLSVIDQNQNSDAVIAVDTMNLWIETAGDALTEVIKKSHILFLNDSEAEMLTGFSETVDAAKYLLDLGPDSVIIKKGSKGAHFFSRNREIFVDAYKVKKVVDPTGAGDAFGGSFIAAKAAGLTDLDSIIEATALASLCVEGFGPSRLTTQTTENEILERIAHLKSKFNS